MKLMDRPLVEALVLSTTRKTIAYAALIECIRLQAAAFIGPHPEGYNLVPLHMDKFMTDAMFGWPEQVEAMSQAATTIRVITKSFQAFLSSSESKQYRDPKRKGDSLGQNFLTANLIKVVGIISNIPSSGEKVQTCIFFKKNSPFYMIHYVEYFSI